MVTFLEADAPRVRCPTHGVVVASVPWQLDSAKGGSGVTRWDEPAVPWKTKDDTP